MELGHLKIVAVYTRKICSAGRDKTSAQTATRMTRCSTLSRLSQNGIIRCQAGSAVAKSPSTSAPGQIDIVAISIITMENRRVGTRRVRTQEFRTRSRSCISRPTIQIRIKRSQPLHKLNATKDHRPSGATKYTQARIRC